MTPVRLPQPYRRYTIDPTGAIRQYGDDEILETTIRGTQIPYAVACLYDTAKRKWTYVKVLDLMILAFRGGIAPGKYPGYVDGDPCNCRAVNVKWFASKALAMAVTAQEEFADVVDQPTDTTSVEHTGRLSGPIAYPAPPEAGRCRCCGVDLTEDRKSRHKGYCNAIVCIHRAKHGHRSAKNLLVGDEQQVSSRGLSVRPAYGHQYYDSQVWAGNQESEQEP